jgi:hypothetical protein
MNKEICFISRQKKKEGALVVHSRVAAVPSASHLRPRPFV